MVQETNTGFDVHTVMYIVNEGIYHKPYTARYINFIVTSGKNVDNATFIGRSETFHETIPGSDSNIDEHKFKFNDDGYTDPFDFHIDYDDGLPGGETYDNLNFKVDIEGGSGVEDSWMLSTLDVRKPKNDPTSLSNPTVSSIGQTSATVGITVEGDPKLNDYYLVVKDSSQNELGRTKEFSDNGSKSIELTGLTEKTKYDSCTVYAYNSDDIDIGITSYSFSFSTLGKEIGDLSDPTVSNITKTTATITTTVGEQGTFYSNGSYREILFRCSKQSGCVSW